MEDKFLKNYLTDEQIKMFTNNFKKELKELLEKYNATISFQVGSCSDTYALYDEEMVITFKDLYSYHEEIIFRTSHWYIDYDILKHN